MAKKFSLPGLYKGRFYIIFQDCGDEEGGEANIHGILVPPADMDITQAKDMIAEAVQRVRTDHPVDWNYGEAIEILKKKGFDHFMPEIWSD